MTVALPEGLRAAGFTVADALDEGLTRGRLRSRELAAPYRGSRAVAAPRSIRDHALAFAPLLGPRRCLAGISALAMLGLPLPWRLERAGGVDVLAPKGRSTPTHRGVRARRMVADRISICDVEGVPVAAPALLWALMARDCTEHELVRIGDAIVTDAGNYPDRFAAGRPLATLDELRTTVGWWGNRAGVATLRDALPRIRERVESPRETDMRLHIVDAGLPEPEVQVTIRDPRTGCRLGRADLLHRHAWVVEEYEGEGHRAKQQWDRDIQKYREFQRIGLHVVRATNRDFVPSPERWLNDLAAMLRQRTPA